MSLKQKKRFLLDTSVIIDSPENLVSLYQNGENELFITDIVLKELNGHKEDSVNEKGFMARSFIRSLDQGILQTERANVKNAKLVSKGSKKQAHQHKVIVNEAETVKKSGDSIHVFKCLFEGFTTPISLFVVNRIKYEPVNNSNDLKIAEIAKDYDLELITNDISLKIIGLSAGITASSMKKDRVDSPENITFQKIYFATPDKLESVRKEIISKERNGNQIILKELLPKEGANKNLDVPSAREEYYLVNGTGLMPVDGESEGSQYKDYRVKPMNIEQKFYLNLLRHNSDILVVTGSTGSGKTLMALQEGIRRVSDKDDKIDGIVYMRNTITANDHVAELGFRKGDQATKLGYFAYPLFGAINFILENSFGKGKEKLGDVSDVNKRNATTQEDHTTEFMAKYNIEVMDIAHARGITISNKFIIFDELQNASLATLKLVGSRVGKNSKLILMGDYLQVDHPYLTKNRNALVSMLQVAMKDARVSAIQLKETIRSATADWFQKSI